MKVYWNENTGEQIGTYSDHSPKYKTVERHGKVVGAFTENSGSSSEFLIIALPGGSFTNIAMYRCHHKEKI